MTVADLPPVLTLWRPWAELYLTVKAVENRFWWTRHRGPLLIHAGKTWDSAAVLFAGAIDECRGISWKQADHPIGIIGWVDLVDVTCGPRQQVAQCHCGDWAQFGQYHWHRENPQHFGQPIPCSGRQGLWYPPTETHAAIRRALGGEVA